MLRLSRTDAWVVRRLLAGMESDGLTGGTSAGLRRLVEHLAGLPIYSRLVAWVAFTASLPEPEAAAAVQAVADADPGQPIPDDQPAAFATLEDVARVSTGAKWLWEGWIPTGSVCAAAATEGCGKTRTMLDWCRRMYLGEDWPDGQPASVPASQPASQRASGNPIPLVMCRWPPIRASNHSDRLWPGPDSGGPSCPGQ